MSKATLFVVLRRGNHSIHITSAAEKKRDKQCHIEDGYHVVLCSMGFSPFSNSLTHDFFFLNSQHLDGTRFVYILYTLDRDNSNAWLSSSRVLKNSMPYWKRNVTITFCSRRIMHIIDSVSKLVDGNKRSIACIALNSHSPTEI